MYMIFLRKERQTGLQGGLGDQCGSSGHPSGCGIWQETKSPDSGLELRTLSPCAGALLPHEMLLGSQAQGLGSVLFGLVLFLS